jgi:tRNA isopentenyl-2-thiomethyl-A-37 hydroxylase MiaE
MTLWLLGENESLVEALTVGATIEDLDIKDLYELLEQTDNSDIKTIYQNLAKGSRNHLRAYISQLSYRNVIYEAQFLTQTQVDDIVTSPRERGRVDENGDQVSGMNGKGSGQRRGNGKGRMAN